MSKLGRKIIKSKENELFHVEIAPQESHGNFNVENNLFLEP